MEVGWRGRRVPGLFLSIRSCEAECERRTGIMRSLFAHSWLLLRLPAEGAADPSECVELGCGGCHGRRSAASCYLQSGRGRVSQRPIKTARAVLKSGGCIGVRDLATQFRTQFGPNSESIRESIRNQLRTNSEPTLISAFPKCMDCLGPSLEGGLSCCLGSASAGVDQVPLRLRSGAGTNSEQFPNLFQTNSGSASRGSPILATGE